MKIIPINLLNHYKQETTTIATVFKLKTKDGEILGFTTFDQDIVFQEEPTVVYKANSGLGKTAIASTAMMNVDNLDVDGFIEDERITESSILSGKFDNAEVLIAELNYMDLPYSLSKINILKTGVIGQVKFSKNKFIAEFRGLTQYLQNNIGKKYQASCRARFGDAKCGVNKALYTFTSTASIVTDNLIINCNLTNANNYFNGGEIKFTSGLNNGLTFEVKNWNNSTQNIELQVTANYQIQAGDTFEITKGCEKTIQYCQDNFSNAVNFRGEPHVPTTDKLINA